MKYLGRVALAVAILALIGGTAQAQGRMRMRPPSVSGVWNPVLGSGATYNITGGESGDITMTVAVVGKETVDGKDGYWLETSFTPAGAPGEMVNKILLVRDGESLTTQKMIMQMGDRPPMEMPEEMLQRGMQRRPREADVTKQADDLGSESVTTPAGTFQCEHYKLKDGSGDYWIKAGTGPYGLIKSVQMSGTTMVLASVVTDAKDKITGTPQPFNPMGRGRGPGR